MQLRYTINITIKLKSNCLHFNIIYKKDWIYKLIISLTSNGLHNSGNTLLQIFQSKLFVCGFNIKNIQDILLKNFLLLKILVAEEFSSFDTWQSNTYIWTITQSFNVLYVKFKRLDSFSWKRKPIQQQHETTTRAQNEPERRSGLWNSLASHWCFPYKYSALYIEQL